MNKEKLDAPVQATQADKRRDTDEMIRLLELVRDDHCSISYALGEITAHTASTVYNHIDSLTSALTAERDALSQQLERVSAERAGLAVSLANIYTECRVIYFPKHPGAYPWEHNPHAMKFCLDEILAQIDRDRALAQTPPKI